MALFFYYFPLPLFNLVRGIERKIWFMFFLREGSPFSGAVWYVVCHYSASLKEKPKTKFRERAESTHTGTYMSS